MTDETKRIVKELRVRGLNNGASLGKHMGICDIAADLIEKLDAEMESDERQYGRDAFETLVAEGVKIKAERDAWKRRAEAAEQDLHSAICTPDEGCVLCAHHHPCTGKDCPQYVAGIGATGQDGKEYPDFKWSCEDFEHGTCPAMEDTPCNGCDFENHWRWRGPCAENGGADGHGQVHLTQRQAAAGQQDMISCETCRLYGRCGREQTDGLECCEDWENGGAK